MIHEEIHFWKLHIHDRRSRVAGNSEVYVRISRNGTVETLVTKTQGGHPIVCEYVTGDSTYTYTDESGRRKLFALR